VVVSRTENLQTYAEGKKNGQHERKNPFHLSPLTHHRATTKGPVLGGFERNKFAQASERAFDTVTGYERSLVDSFVFKHAMKHGDETTKTAMRQAAAREQAAEKPKNAPQATNAPKIVLTLTPIVKPKRQEAAKTDDLRQQLGTAYQKKDTGDLAAALLKVEQERQRQERQRQEDQRNEELKRPKIAQEQVGQEQQEQQHKVEKTPPIEPKRPKTGPKR
jgi:hypothetical protein